MKENSNSHVAIVSAIDKGYSIDKLGKITNCKGSAVLGTIHNHGYRVATISLGKRPNRKYVKLMFHQFQAFQKFSNEIIDDEECIHIRHLNGNKLDNSWANISIGTASENYADRPLEQRTKFARIGGMTCRSDKSSVHLPKEDKIESPEIIMKSEDKEKEIDERAVDAFAIDMKATLARSRELGKSGWYQDADLEDCLVAKLQKVSSGVETTDRSLLDIANYTMMIYQSGADAVILSNKLNKVLVTPTAKG